MCVRGLRQRRQQPASRGVNDAVRGDAEGDGRVTRQAMIQTRGQRGGGGGRVITLLLCPLFFVMLF